MDDVTFGLNTFGDIPADDAGTSIGQGAAIRAVIEQGVLADELGVDAFGVGEHHRDDFAVSAPEVVLAAIAARTSRIRLGSAVTVLSSDDPVRVVERFNTLQAISGGRAEIVAGRGSFTESFPLFGYDLSQYEELFEEKLDLLARLLPGEPVTWRGSTRAGVTDAVAHPVAETPVPLWVGVGGSPESVVRTARTGANLMLAIIGGEPARFAPFARLLRDAEDRLGRPHAAVGMHSPGHVADTDEQAADELWGPFRENFGRIGRERGWPPMTIEQFRAGLSPEGAIYAGSPETVAQKIARNLRAVGATRFDLKYATGPMPHAALMRGIERYATQVIPRVRELLADGDSAA